MRMRRRPAAIAAIAAAVAALAWPGPLVIRVKAVNPRLTMEAQRDAPEFLVLRVTAARREPKVAGLSAWQQQNGVRVWNVWVAAEVLEVRRSATGLKPGAHLILAYESYEPADDGAGPPPILAVGQRCAAFLERTLIPAPAMTTTTVTYRPVVGANSFPAVPPPSAP